jgi:hypothetical protein
LLEFNRICKNTHAWIFEIFYNFFKKKINTGVFFLEDLTVNPKWVPLNETFENLNTIVWNVSYFSTLISKWCIILYPFVKLSQKNNTCPWLLKKKKKYNRFMLTFLEEKLEKKIMANVLYIIIIIIIICCEILLLQ